MSVFAYFRELFIRFSVLPLCGFVLSRFIYRELADKFKKASFSPNIVFEADEYSSIAASVTTGAGVAIMPRLPILDTFNLRLIPFSDVPMTREICLLRYRFRAMSPAVQSVWDFTAQHTEQ